MTERAYRQQEMFWLEADNPVHQEASKIIRRMKKKRQFNPSVVDGLRLIASLQEGDTSVLFELFPLLEQQFQTASTPSGGDSDKLLREVETIKQLLANQGAYPASPNGLAMRPKDGATKSDEPAIELTKAAKSDEPNWWDGAITMAVLTGDFTKLSPAIVEYGIRVGRVPAQYGKPKPMSVAAIPSGDGNSKVMQVPQFAAPVFDDD